MEATESYTDLVCVYMLASGPSYADCAYLGRRNRRAYGMNAADADFWIMVSRPESDPPMTYWRGPWKNFITGLWRSLSGATYVSDATLEGVHVFDDVMAQGPGHREYPLQMLAEGVWGLDDQNVFAWGTRKGASGAHEHPIYRWDGRDWREMPAPGFAVTVMHGVAPDLIYAAGWQGGLACWDGRAWTTLPLPTGEVLTDVFVAGPDEVYATGMNGSLLEGSASGWHLVTRTQDERLPFTCVAKWQGELYVGGGPLGLFRRQGTTNVLEHIKPKVDATSFDVRQSLVITCANRLVGSDDGVTFKSCGNDVLATKTAHIDIADW